MPHRRPAWARAASGLLAITFLFLITGRGTGHPLPRLFPDKSDSVVFLSASGLATRTLTIFPARHPSTYLPGGLLTIDVVCQGTGVVSVRVQPDGEADEPT